MIDPKLFDTGASTGAMPDNAVADLQKALEAGYGTDVATLTGGAALRIQSLDTTMQAVIQENRHFTLFNKLPKPKVGATVDEWTEQSGVGGVLGGTTNTETGIITEETGEYARRVGMVKFLMTRRQVSFVATLQNSITDAEATEYRAGTMKLLSDANFLCYEGDSSVVETEFDGIWAQMRNGVAEGQVDGANIIDANGAPLDGIDLINKAAAQTADYGNFGQLTDIFFCNAVQADFDTNLDPAFRVALDQNPNSVALGTRVRAIRTSHGDIATNMDVFIRDEKLMVPFELRRPGPYAAIAASLAGAKPQSVTGTTATDASSKFAAAHAGNYYYAVTGINAKGQSTVTKSAQIAVAAGEKVVLEITGNAAAEEKGYVIYRSRLNGTDATADLREVARIPKAPGGTTTWTDLNREIPGTTKAYLLNMNPGDTAILWRQMLPMVKFPLYPTNAAVVPWAQLLFGYLRMSKRRHHAVITNILPRASAWKPFG